MGKWVRRSLFGAGVLLYLGCLLLAWVGSQGLMGMTPDPFAAVFLILIGMPWSLLGTAAALAGAPTWVGAVVMAASPLVNLYILWRLCFGRRN